MAPTLNAGFAHLPGAFRSLAADVLLPPAPEGAHGRRPLLRGAALLGASAALALGGAVLLVRELDLQLGAGERLLISGPSGCGKTSLLRVLCGLVPAAGGRMVAPAAAEWLVLPQKPYLALGSLRDQLTYTLPQAAGAVGEEEPPESSSGWASPACCGGGRPS
jgi:hypothetical protein